ncbi:hypothetical protein BZARG_2671 [Bizionia argentinensis JUB59]|uniref:STAS/SEC14 domain-containing protein n=1 Tax=Bizionia argentinensis JUB59 TaxID=1046627 RepID=G2EHQ8_9FLAO|nr:hypothetical protein [Bizionia argentinensis]EGV42034.2 hypothetical protein BZARG_2671 [Bizionia argentinensis JUB59]
MPIIKKYHFGEISFHENYMIAVMNEGLSISLILNNELYGIARNHFKLKDFVYITHRKNSYSVDPNIYFEMSKIKNLIGFAVVLGDTIQIDNTDFERSFISIPFKAFNALEDATDWANDLCAK